MDTVGCPVGSGYMGWYWLITRTELLYLLLDSVGSVGGDGSGYLSPGLPDIPLVSGLREVDTDRLGCPDGRGIWSGIRPTRPENTMCFVEDG